MSGTEENSVLRVEHVIVAPHPDDEIIGCCKVLQEAERVVVVYTEYAENERREEALTLRDNLEKTTIHQLFQSDIPPVLINKKNIFYFPDPYFEVHPAHRKWGMVGEQLLRYSGMNVIFYTVNMQAPYIFETKEPDKKRALLDLTYPSQILLWDNDSKYYLFEGYCKWIM